MKSLLKTMLSIIVALGLFMVACDDDHPITAPDKSKTYVLVHGAFQGAYAWQLVKPELEKSGHKVIAIELPAHGEDKTPPAQATLKSYIEKVVNVINAEKEDVILVGHSMGGMVITGAAEQIPDRITKLVYIAAFVPASGQTLLELSSTDSTSLLGASLIPSADGLTLDVKPDRIVPIFAQDANAEISKLLIDKRRAEPSIIFPEKITVTAANWGRVDKFYVFTKRDNTVGPNLQKRMVSAAKISKTTTIDTDHSPFLTKPSLITEILLNQ